MFALLFADWAVAESFEARLVRWVQANMAEGFERGQFSSAALSVVRSEEEVLSITFGLSDAQARTVAHPYQTRFRISSITKVFSAVAIAQLLQEGRIESLDDPVNAYLKRFRLPDNDGEAVTIHHLMTHSAGFDYSNFGLYSGNHPLFNRRQK